MKKALDVVAAAVGAALLLSAGSARCAEPPDLTLANFFDTGWREKWTRYPHTDGAPDLSLFRVQPNFLSRALRLDYLYEERLDTNPVRSAQTFTAFAEHSFNRRFMLAAVGTSTHLDSRLGEDEDGRTWGALARLQLVDTRRASCAMSFRVMAPNRDLGTTQTLISSSISGWHDLSPLGLGRTGIYWHVQEETYAGPHRPGARQNALNTDVSLAYTWTGPHATLGNLTTFLEAYGRTDLDGPRARKVAVSLTPGMRCTVAHHHVLIAGLEMPISAPRQFEHIFRFTYMYSF